MDEKLYIRPNKQYKSKIIVCAILAVVAFVIPEVLPVNYQVTRLVLCIGIVCAGYAVFDLLFKVNLTYVFDPAHRMVYQKVYGLYSRKLMTFEETYILAETIDGELHYVISNKKNKFGRNYSISPYFSDTKKGRRKQEVFENEVLTAVEDLLSGIKQSGPSFKMQ